MSTFPNIYCVKCRSKTTNVPGTQQVVTRKNGRKSVAAKCSKCGITKSLFVPKNYDGAGIIGQLLGLPNGQVPVLGQLPVLGALF